MHLCLLSDLNMYKRQTKYYKIDPASNFGKLSLGIQSDYLIKPNGIKKTDHNGNDNPSSKSVNLNEQEDVVKNGDVSACMDLDETETIDEKTYSQLPIQFKEGQAQIQQYDNVEDTKYEVDGKYEIVDEEHGECMNSNHYDEIQDQNEKEYEELNKSQQKNGFRYSDAFKLKVVQYSQDHSIRQTAAKFGVSKSQVSRWMKNADTFVNGNAGNGDEGSCRRFKFSQSERLEALNYITTSRTHSVKRAAEKFGVPINTLYSWKRIRTTSYAIAFELVEELVKEAENLSRNKVSNVEVLDEDLHAAAAVRPCFVKLERVSYADSEIDTKSVVQISIRSSKLDNDSDDEVI